MQRYLPPQLAETLDVLREQQSQDIWKWLTKKLYALNEWAAVQGYDKLLVRVESTVHSALALSMARAARRLDNCPFKHLIALTTAPLEATQTHALLAANFDVRYVDLEPLQQALAHTVCNAQLLQCANACEAAATAAMLQVMRAQDDRLATLGFVDRDQSAYLGDINIALEGSCDVQLLTDLHRSEIFELAAVTGVRPPDGKYEVQDVHSLYASASSEEAELYARLNRLSPDAFATIRKGWSDETQEWVIHMQARIALIHDAQRRVYQGASPCVHLDLTQPPTGGLNYKPWN